MGNEVRVGHQKMDITKNRIESKAERVTESGCWIWTGTVTSRGYGQLISHNKKVYAHRASFQAFVGDIPDGMVVCHACDNVHCVNPDHLFLGTQKDNLQDMKHKGRSTRGEKNTQAVLTESKVMEIKSLLDAGWTQEQVAKHFKVSRSNIGLIKRKARWNHV